MSELERQPLHVIDFETAKFVRAGERFLRKEMLLCSIPDDVVMGGGHRALASALRDQIEVVPFSYGETFRLVRRTERVVPLVTV